MNTQVPIMTLDIQSHTQKQLTPPLMSVDWSPSNKLIVGGVANGHWAIWDIAQTRYYCMLLKIDYSKNISSHFVSWMESLYQRMYCE